MPSKIPALTTLTAVVLAGALTACSSSGSGSGAGTGDAATGTSSSGAAATTAPSSASGAKAGGATVKAPCDVTDQKTVASVFAGAGTGTAGEVRNCNYPLSGGGDVLSVNVFFYGSSDDWDSQKASAASIGGPLKTLAIGDDAFLAAKGGGAVTVKKGSIVFAVQVLPNGYPDQAFFTKHEAQVEALATKIAAEH